MDEQMFEIYQKAFNQLEKLEKRASVQLNLSRCQYQKTMTEEHFRATNVYFEVTDETLCSQCFSTINKYPFSFLPES